MKQKMKYGKDTLKYARVLMGRGVSISVISAETGLSEKYLYVIKSRLKAAENTASEPVQQNITPDNTSDITTLQAEPNITKEQKSITKKSYKALELEAVFCTTSAAACYGAVIALPGVIGWALAVVYGLLCFNSLQMAKCGDIPATAEHGKNRVWALELAAVFAHYYTVNRALWANIDALPFDVKYVPESGNWVYNEGVKVNGIWQGGEVIFYLSVSVAVLLSAAAIEAVNTRLKLTKEQGK